MGCIQSPLLVFYIAYNTYNITDNGALNKRLAARISIIYVQFLIYEDILANIT